MPALSGGARCHRQGNTVLSVRVPDMRLLLAAVARQRFKRQHHRKMPQLPHAVRQGQHQDAGN